MSPAEKFRLEPESTGARWSGIPISFRIFQFIVIHTVKGFGIVNKTEIDVFLELSCFFHDPADVGNLISGSSAFSKTKCAGKILSSEKNTYCKHF